MCVAHLHSRRAALGAKTCDGTENINLILLLVVKCALFDLQLLDYLGRPTLSTLDNNTQNPKSGLLEYIPAVQTRPFDVTTSSSSGSSAEAGGCDDSTGSSGSNGGSGSSSRLGLSASWDEELCVDAAPQQLVEADALLLLELLQLPGGFTRYKVRWKASGSSGGLCKATGTILKCRRRQSGLGDMHQPGWQVLRAPAAHSPGQADKQAPALTVLAVHDSRLCCCCYSYCCFCYSAMLGSLARQVADTPSHGPSCGCQACSTGSCCRAISPSNSGCSCTSTRQVCPAV
jgi:hypothetical protein